MKQEKQPKPQRQKKARKPLNLKASFQTRSFRVGGYSVVATAIVLAIIIAVNLIVSALPEKYTKLDTTSNQLFTLSDQTKSLVSNLTQEVTIYWIVSSGSEDSYLETLLSRYADLSDNLKVVKRDPDVYPTFVQQYTDSATANSLVVECGSRSRYVDYYDIYVLDYYSYYYYGTTSWSFYGESELTSAIDYVISEDLPMVYLLTGHGEQDIPDTFTDALEKENVDTQSLSLLTVDEVPEDADCILIYAPQSDLSTEETDMLLEYLNAGGNLFVITEPLQDTTLTNLEALMALYGVTKESGVVVEGSRSYYALNNPFYLLPEINSHTITSPLISEGYYVLLPVAEGLLVSDELPDNVSVTELLVTSSSAYSKVNGLTATTYEKEDGDVDGPFALAVAITDSEADSSIVWVSSAYLLNESANSRVSGGNQDFFLNAVSWMCDADESSISIHAKELSYEYLTMDSGTASTLAVLAMGVIPLAYLAVGIVIHVRRKRR